MTVTVYNFRLNGRRTSYDSPWSSLKASLERIHQIGGHAIYATAQDVAESDLDEHGFYHSKEKR